MCHISFHPVDLRLVEARIVPYLAGRTTGRDLDDLLARAVRQAGIRLRVEAWRSGLLAATGAIRDDRYLPGRPYLIVADDTAEVAEAVARYADCAVHQVDALVREQLAVLDPALVARVRPVPNGAVPGVTAVAGSVATLRSLRTAVHAVRSGRRTVRIDGVAEVDAAELLTTTAQLGVVEFLAALMPGWIVGTAPVRIGEIVGHLGFSSNGPLLGSLPAEFPTLAWATNLTVPANRAVGGCLPSARIGAARAGLARRAAAPVADRMVGVAANDRGRTVRGCGEALAVAEATGVAVVEATGIA